MWGMGVTAASGLAPYTDPPGYPSAWPPALDSQDYTFEGSSQSDLSGAGDDSRAGVPAAYSDFSAGPSQLQSSFYHTATSSVLYFRLRLAGSPLQLAAPGPPLKAATWNILVDTDGDGYKEFVALLDGTDGSSGPDDLIVLYGNTASQTLSTAQEVWRQDTAGTDDGIDGAEGGIALWDIDGDPYVWDLRRLRIIQIDSSLPPGDEGSEYFLDVQIPLTAFDASAVGGPALSSTIPIALTATTSSSFSDPLQFDLLFAGEFALADVPLPMGDQTAGGTLFQTPTVTSVTATACPAPVFLSATVHDAIGPGSTGVVETTVAAVQFEFFADLNADGQANDGGGWTLIGGAQQGSGGLSQWGGSWNIDLLPNGSYLVRAVATDSQGNETDSTDQPAQLLQASVVATVANECSIILSLAGSSQSVTDLNGGVVVPGDTLVYSITLKNSGIEVPGATVRDTIGVDLEYVAGSAIPEPAQSGAQLLWNVGPVAAGAEQSFSFAARVPASTANQTTIENRGWISTGTTTELVTAAVRVVSLPRIQLSTTVDGGSSFPGDTLVYRVTYANVGTDAATAVRISDEAPSTVSYVTNSVTVNGLPRTDASDGDNVEVAEDQITVEIDTVAVGETGEIRFLVRID